MINWCVTELAISPKPVLSLLWKTKLVSGFCDTSIFLLMQPKRIPYLTLLQTRRDDIGYLLCLEVTLTLYGEGLHRWVR